MATEHILLTALGTFARPTVYEMNGQTAEAPLTPLALLRLLPEPARPNRVLALVTEGARKTTWEPFADNVQEILGVSPELVAVPEGRTPAEIRHIVETAASRFPADVELTMDVTQGLRHFPFVAYALALYLTSLRGIRLRGAYYGLCSVQPAAGRCIGHR